MVRTFAKVLLVNERGEILFLRRSETDTERPDGWDFPGGTIEAGEDPFDGLAREVHEETGVQVHDPQLVFAAPRTGDYGTGCWLFYLDYVPNDTSVALSAEHNASAWWTPEAALADSGYPAHQELLEFVIQNRLLDKRVYKTVTCRALLVNETGELLIVRRSATDPYHPGMWDLPGGRAEPGEHLVETAVRETKEECGIVIANPTLVYGTSQARLQGTGTWLFYQVYIPADTPVYLSNEHDEYRWVPAADLPQYTDYDVLTRMHDFAMAYRLYNAE